ncbi:NAD(P)-dependent oxidoreductase [Rhizobium calliandrae]|uniref:NAD(P)-dependent oxidoreductase n=1 Tax=Rhizobium calliandrae TaxID=1312182 RepID=A0ABT7KFM7_9HYPH|nr:NAD(P)-dependent oxidoreductase [Rhizobium calliandrae]MDL2407421.1 NAD(P)-dependent oxidoreductase [Rhizobium calliandrae]
MAETIFLAGATGAIGRKLVPMLIEAGFTVHGTTRKPELVDSLRALGATPVVVDVFDGKALEVALRQAKPDIVIHQLTDLPFGLDPAQMAEGRIRNARLREVGTKNLVDAAVAAGEIMEETPLQESATAIRTLEALTLTTAGIADAVLRYGLLYGPETGADAPGGVINLYVEDAARAALLAVQSRAIGIFNVVEDGGPVSNAKAKSVLGW